jgi:hypothetical protein
LEVSNCADKTNVKEGAQYLKELICNKTFIARKKPTVNPQKVIKTQNWRENENNIFFCPGY